jgi:hypothetical protein
MVSPYHLQVVDEMLAEIRTAVEAVRRTGVISQEKEASYSGTAVVPSRRTSQPAEGEHLARDDASIPSLSHRERAAGEACERVRDAGTARRRDLLPVALPVGYRQRSADQPFPAALVDVRGRVPSRR